MKHQPTKSVRLTESDRAELRKLRTDRPWLWSYGALAEHFGCSRWTATAICKDAARSDLENAQATYAALAEEIRKGNA